MKFKKYYFSDKYCKDVRHWTCLIGLDKFDNDWVLPLLRCNHCNKFMKHPQFRTSFPKIYNCPHCKNNLFK